MGAKESRWDLEGSTPPEKAVQRAYKRRVLGVLHYGKSAAAQVAFTMGLSVKLTFARGPLLRMVFFMGVVFAFPCGSGQRRKMWPSSSA